MIQIPHIACLVHNAANFMPLTQSPLNLVTCVDVFDCDFFKGMNFNNVFFMPQGVESDLEVGSSNRIYEVAIFTTLIDYIEIRNSWLERFSPIVAQAFVDAAEMALTIEDASLVQCLVNVIDNLTSGPLLFDPNSIDYASALIEIESYVNGKNQTGVVSSIKEARVDIFGAVPKTTSWNKFIGNNKNIKVHKPIDFKQTIEVMKQSKIVVNTCASIKNGGHENVFTSLAAGALSLTPSNIFMRQYFKNGKNIAFYNASKLDEINDQIQMYLKDEVKRQEVAVAGREVVMNDHTWDKRAENLLKEINPILQKMRVKKS
jgi:glycosyltransferase involved in cell wall biosynthesis